VVQGLAIMLARPWDFAVAAVVSFLVNLFCYLAIKHVSATSFKVAGCLKNVLVVWGGILQGDVVTAKEVQVRLQGLAPRAGCPACLLGASRRVGGGSGGVPACCAAGRQMHRDSFALPLPAGLHDIACRFLAVLCISPAWRERRGQSKRQQFPQKAAVSARPTAADAFFRVRCVFLHHF
jgi:hypothetical protein